MSKNLDEIPAFQCNVDSCTNVDGCGIFEMRTEEWVSGDACKGCQYLIKPKKKRLRE